ncbi:MAG: S41 family peptidase, partial [Planctomycetota bacterium]
PAEKQDTRPAKDEPIDAKKDKAEDKKGDDKKDEKKTKIDLDGLARRVLVAEGVSAGNYFRCEAIKGGCLYLSKSEPEFTKYQVVTDHTGGGLTLHKYTLEDKSTAKLMSGIANYHQSADGKKLIYRAGGSYGVVDAGKPGNVGDGKLALDKIRLELDRPQEFRQIFNEAWRIQRDWFYDPNMHSVDWAAMREQYGRFVPFCGNRGDLNYLIGEMLGELNIGHTYISGGEWASKAKNVSTGLLGVEFAIDGEHYRIARIIPGTPGDPSERSPLDEPGCPIKAGMYLLAIDGHKLTTADDPCRFLQNKANAVVTLTYNAKPTRDGAKEHRVRTIASEFGIRYREWVEKKRKYVEEQTNGEVGYLHIPDMGENGVREFAKAWHWQYYKKGIVLDERYNGGGHTADMIIDRLERKAWCVTAPREGKPQIGPERCFWGPWCVLVNEDTGSNGEFFAEAIKVKKLAPIIGMRTWGGAIGIEPHQDLVDGGSCTPPQFGLYSLDRKWLIEGVGVVPDMEVQNMPGDVLRGKDAQLDFAIEYVLKEIKANPKELPAAPPYPDKSKKVPPEKASPLKP